MATLAAQSEGINEFDEVLGLEGKEITVAGKTLRIEPLKAHQFSKILRRIQSLREQGVVEIKLDNMDELAAELAAAKPGDVFQGLRKRMKGFDLVKMILNGGEEGLSILEHASGQPHNFVLNIDLVNLVKLAKEVVELNLDFFSRNRSLLEVILGDAWGKIQELLKEISTTPSASSSETGTESKASETTP